MSARVRSRRAQAVLVALIVVFSMAMPHRAATAADFYTPPSPLPAGKSGDVIRSERMNYKATVPALARAWRVLYLSTSATGRQIAVSGAVIVPILPYGGPRPIIGYAPGLHGLGDQCAPSRQIDAGTDTEASLISLLLGRGWAVAVTDYEALGTPGDHTYMVGPSAGHAVLDVMRAATRLVDWALAASESDAVVAVRFFRVNSLIDAPIRLLHPAFVCRAAVVNLRRRRGDGQPRQAEVAGQAS